MTSGGAATRRPNHRSLVGVALVTKISLKKNTEALQSIDDTFGLARHERMDRQNPNGHPYVYGNGRD
jgi:hypothetical protein